MVYNSAHILYQRHKTCRNNRARIPIFLKSKLKAYLNIEINQINDPLKKAKDIGHYSSEETEIIIADRGELSYVLSLIKQAYERS